MDMQLRPFICTTLIILAGGLLTAQPSAIATIYEIEPPQNHYKELQKISSETQLGFRWMDSIVYPPESYQNLTILFAVGRPEYLSTAQVDYLATSVRFPANSSKQTRAELDFLLKLQAQRTDAQTARVMELAEIGYWPPLNYLSSHPDYQRNLEHLFFEYREVIGSDCTAEKYPNTSVLMQGVMNDMRIMEFAVKYQLLRARPYQLEGKLDPLVKISSPSFASGHTLWAYIQAYTFAELIPAKRKEFLDLAYEIAFSREIMGVHYPSDEEVARQIAHRMLFLMWHTDKFQEDFRKAKAEWR
jgi:acid phosphatase (class A)